ncbi:jg18899 [Pararge aegeria aegeria]|uniref:Jg18899 protein n=1 Tax=Pararge aegeria aegeria TaxID=348720 RepID=A0A8S4QTG7_9NEOP|nr:jg18899 [Pararge aegeria aegeria]
MSNYLYLWFIAAHRFVEIERRKVQRARFPRDGGSSEDAAAVHPDPGAYRQVGLSTAHPPATCLSALSASTRLDPLAADSYPTITAFFRVSLLLDCKCYRTSLPVFKRNKKAHALCWRDARALLSVRTASGCSSHGAEDRFVAFSPMLEAN